MLRLAARWAVMLGMATAALAAAPPPTYEILIDTSGGITYLGKTVDEAALQSALNDAFKQNPEATVVIRLPKEYEPAILHPALQAALKAGFSDNIVPTTDEVKSTVNPALPAIPASPAETAAPPAGQAPAQAAEKPHQIDLRTPDTMTYDGLTVNESQLKEKLTQVYATNPNAAFVIYLNQGYDPSILQSPLKCVTMMGFVDIAVTTDAPGTAEKSSADPMPTDTATEEPAPPAGLAQADTPANPEPQATNALPGLQKEGEPEILLPAPDPTRVLVYDSLLKAVVAGDLYDTLGHLAAGQQLYARDESGRDAFLLAAENGFTAMLPYVLKATNLLESKDSAGNTALHLAAAQGQTRTIEWLLRHGADKESRNNENYTPLLYAAMKGRAESVVTLYALGADPFASSAPAGGRNAIEVAIRAKRWNVSAVLHQLGVYKDINYAASSGDLGMVRTMLDEEPPAIEAEQLNNATPLLSAALAGQTEVVEFLLTRGADMETTTFEGLSVLGAALESGNLNTAKALVNAGLPPNSYLDRKFGIRPLHWCAKRNQMAMATTFLDLGALPDDGTLAGERPLHTAVIAGSGDVATLLLERGASPSIQSDNGYTPIHFAAELNKIDMAEILFRYKADIQLANRAGQTPLHCAAEKDHQSMVDWLLDHGARIDATTAKGETALHIAARIGDVPLLQDLVTHGAPLEVVAVSGFTPFLSAIAAGNWPAADALLKLGANRLQVDREGNTALHLVMEHQWIELLPQFETLGIPWDALNRKERSPLFLALQTEKLDAVEWLLAHGVMADRVDIFGQTPLFAAAEQGGLHVTKRLLDAGANPNKQDQWGRTPVHLAAKRGNPMLLRILVEGGGRLDITDLHGQLPLHFAADSGHWGCMQFQLLRGVNVNTADQEGRTPFYFTAKNGYFMASRNLLRCGASFATHDAMGSTPITMLKSFLTAYAPLLFSLNDTEKERNQRYVSLITLSRDALAEEVARAVVQGKTDRLQALVSLYPWIANQRFLGETPLHRAARAGGLEAVRLLIKAGADVNRLAHTPEGYAPLHEAARNGFAEVVACLVEAGASTTQKAANGETPMDSARNAGKESVFKKP